MITYTHKDLAGNVTAERVLDSSAMLPKTVLEMSYDELREHARQLMRECGGCNRREEPEN